ncbi:MAG TPA: hypothetical protein VI636_21100 [Candidatus Angelobacter sp.]
MSRREIKAKVKSWDDAIKDAEQRIRDLQFSIGVFRERRASGVTWPGIEEAQEQQKSPQEGG